MVERQPSKLNVASSSLVSRSKVFGICKCDGQKIMPSKDGAKEYNRLYYQQNREQLLKKQAEKNRRFADNRRRWLVEYKKSLERIR